jgi:hypothetical protein
MTYLLHKIVSAKVLPERSKGGYGVLFAFSDGWVEACFHMTKEEAERQTRRIGGAFLCRPMRYIEDVTVMSMLRVPSWSPSAATQGSYRRCPIHGRG